MSAPVQHRRAFLKRLILALASGAVVVGVEGRLVFASGTGFLPADEELLWRMLGGIELGVPFHGDWILDDAFPPMAGGVSLVVSHPELPGALRVDICRRDEPVRAPAFTESLELFIMDGGGGVKWVPDELMLALQALADQLQDNSAQWMLSRQLLTHRERVQQFPDFMGRAASELTPTAP